MTQYQFISGKYENILSPSHVFLLKMQRKSNRRFVRVYRDNSVNDPTCVRSSLPNFEQEISL